MRMMKLHGLSTNDVIRISPYAVALVLGPAEDNPGSRVQFTYEGHGDFRETPEEVEAEFEAAQLFSTKKVR